MQNPPPPLHVFASAKLVIDLRNVRDNFPMQIMFLRALRDQFAQVFTVKLHWKCCTHKDGIDFMQKSAVFSIIYDGMEHDLWRVLVQAGAF